MSTSTSALTSPTAPRPLQLVDGNVPSPLTSPTAGLISPSCTVCPSPLSAGLPTPPPSSRRPASANPRRQSSISYFPSDHTRILDLRSPTSPSSFAFKPGSRRSNSLHVKAGEAIVPKVKAERHSLGSVNGIKDPSSPGLVVDRGPLTLTEKHADLLHFIAQKESKCLELRSQLAVHEAELHQLKRKWERIVSRGMDRAYSSTSSSTVLPLSATSSSNGAVLDGIKEGVQGVGRLLAAGLDLSSSSPTQPILTSQVVSGFASVSRASMAPVLKKAKHANTQSMSSVSTAETTSSTNGSAGTRLSQSSASSVSLLEDDEDKNILNFDDERAQRHPDSILEDTEGVVMADILISPSSEIKSAKLLRRRSREVPKVTSPLSPLSGVDSPMSPSPAPKGTSNRSSMVAKRATTGLPPASSISGLGPLNVQPVSSWMGSMGSSVGKKWEELQKGETFTKSQKRASVLLSDVSQSIFAALSSPPPTYALSSPSSSATPSVQHNHPPRSSSSISVSSNPFLATISPLSSSPITSSPSPLSHPGSLLEDDESDGELNGNGLGGKSLGEVLIPNIVNPSASGNKIGGENANAKQVSLDDDDDWNW